MDLEYILNICKDEDTKLKLVDYRTTLLNINNMRKMNIPLTYDDIITFKVILLLCTLESLIDDDIVVLINKYSNRCLLCDYDDIMHDNLFICQECIIASVGKYTIISRKIFEAHEGFVLPEGIRLLRGLNLSLSIQKASAY